MLSLALTVLGACQDASTAPRAGVWTTFDFLERLPANRPMAAGVDERFPAGFAPRQFVAPYDAARHVVEEGRNPALPAPALTLQHADGFSDGNPLKLVTTELWANFDKVWVQPLYVPVTAWNPADPWSRKDPNQRWVFGIGPRSPFYGSYWQVFFYEVPASATPQQYRSSAQILGDRLPLHAGPDLVTALLPGQAAFSHPPNELLPLRAGVGWVDGMEDPVAFLDFGARHFAWNERGEVAESPLFVFLVAGPDGAWRPAGLPEIAGVTPPLGQAPPPDLTGKHPLWALWRLWTVRLPASARVFVDRDDDDARDRYAATPGVRVAALAPDLAETPAGALGGKVALNGDRCLELTAAEGRDGVCVWLDSHAAIEAHLSSAIERTPFLITCPLIIYPGNTVP